MRRSKGYPKTCETQGASSPLISRTHDDDFTVTHEPTKGGSCVKGSFSPQALKLISTSLAPSYPQEHFAKDAGRHLWEWDRHPPARQRDRIPPQRRTQPNHRWRIRQTLSCRSCVLNSNAGQVTLR